MKKPIQFLKPTPKNHSIFRFVLLVLVLIHASHAIEWQTSPDAYWALGCDFVGGDIGSAAVSGELCSSACSKVKMCTHFSWTLYNGGTCWYKSSPGVSKSESIASSRPSSMCGILRSTTDSPPEPEAPIVGHQTLTSREKYLPVFRFDGAAGSYCFPDDKREFASRNEKCNTFDRMAPVFVSSKICGKYDVYQYNLWYGWQKACAEVSDLAPVLPVAGLVDDVGFGGFHDDDNEYVQVWVSRDTGDVSWVRYNQHNGYYFRGVDEGAEMKGSRAVVYIGKIAHGAYHRGCTGNPFRGGTRKCLGFCGYWDDFRNPNGEYELDQGAIVDDPSPRDIDCDPGMCKPGHSSSRALTSSSCYGVDN